VVLNVIARRQFPAPRVIDDDSRADLSGLDDRFDLAPVLRSPPSSFGQQELDRTVVVIVATLKEGVGIKKSLDAIFRPPALKEILPDSFWDENDREEKSQIGYQLQVIERNNARAVDGTAAFAHCRRI
jgi:hypothetical protein